MNRPCLLSRSFFLLLPAWICGGAFVLSTASADWSHYRGPSANGVSAEKIPALSPDGPQPAWSAAVGTGTSSVTVSGDRVFTMGNLADKDIVWCLNAQTGAVIWKFEYPLSIDKRMFEGGTASTPTVDGNRVYTVSHQGDLFCLDAATGHKVWYKHFQKEFGGRRPQWGYSGSPLVEGKLLIVDVGGKGTSTVAFDKATGSVVWKSGDDEPGYASPLVATIAGKRTVVVFKASHLVGLDLKDGQELWRTEWKTSYNVNAATPLISGDRILISSAYGTGSGLYEVSAAGIKERWRNKLLKSHVSTPVIADGHLFGLDGQADPKAALVCLDLATGAEKWREPGIGGALVAAGGRLVVLTEKGELIIAEASSSGFRPLSRTQVLGRRSWAQPTVANGLIFCRNNDGNLVALKLN